MRDASGATRAARWHFAAEPRHRGALRLDAAAAAQAAGAVDLDRRCEPRGPWWTGLTRDVLYARRAIVQRPLLSFTVVVTLALALAANSTTFSLMDALVLRPYRFAGVDRLRRRDHGAPRRPTSSIGSTSRPRIFASGASSRAPSRTGRCTSGGTPTCPASTSPSRCPAFFVSPGFFELLGSTPDHGPRVHRRARRSRASTIASCSDTDCGRGDSHPIRTSSARACGWTASRTKSSALRRRASPRPMAPSCGRRLR